MKITRKGLNKIRNMKKQSARKYKKKELHEGQNKYIGTE